MMESLEVEVHETLAAINRAWRESRPSEMDPYLHPKVTMVLPGFSGTIVGKSVLVSSFAEFCLNARVLDYEEKDEQIQVIGNVAFASFRFEIFYERATYRERSSGRDVWAFVRSDGRWLAIWRTMVELKGERSE
jgi:hypothetical protein